MIRLFVTVDELTAVMAAGYTHIYVYTDTTESGAFTTLDGSIVLVAGTPSYEYTDTDGTSATWYKTAYYGAVPGVGTKGAARKGDTRATYATIEELREDIDKTKITADLTLERILTAATLSIDRACNRPDGFISLVTATVRTYAGSGVAYQYIDEATAITLVAVKDSSSDTTYTSWAATDWIAFSGSIRFPDFNSLPYCAIMVDPNGNYSTFTSGLYSTRRGFRPYETYQHSVPTVQVTAKWGYSVVVPGDIKMACLMQAARWFKRIYESSMADSLASGEVGSLLYQKALDPDIKRLLNDGRYVKPVLGVW